MALLVTTAAVQLLHLKVETIEARFGAISGGWPSPSEVTDVSALTRESAEESSVNSPVYARSGRDIPPGVQIYASDGPFFFGAAEKFKETRTLNG